MNASIKFQLANTAPCYSMGLALPHLVGLIPPFDDGDCFGKLCRLLLGSPISHSLQNQFPSFDCSLFTYLLHVLLRWLGGLNTCGF